MKGLMKQPLFLGGIAAFVLAIVLVVVGCVTHPEEKVAKKFCKGLQKMDITMVSQCMAPQVRDGYTTFDFAIGTIFESYSDDETAKMTYIIGKGYDSTEEGVRIVPVTIEIKRDKEVVDVYRMDIEIIEVDGEEYIRDFY